MFKTIFARFGNIKAGNFVSEDGENLSDVQKVLAKFDIQLYDTQGNMNNLADIIDTVASKWGNLTDVERNALATAIAGTRQRENFLVLMENYNNALNYETVAMNSSGFAMQKYNKYLGGVEASQEKLTATFEKLVQKAVDSGLIKGFYDLGSSLLSVLNVVAPLVPWLVKLGLAMAMGKAIQTTSDKLRDLAIRLNDLYEQGLLQGKLQKKIGAIFKGIGGWATVGSISFFAAFEVANAAITNYTENLEKSVQKTQEALNKSTTYYSSLISFSKELEKLATSSVTYEDRETLEEKINSQIDEINEKYKTNYQRINLINGSLEKQKELLSGINEQIKTQTIKDIDANIQAQKKKQGTIVGNLWGVVKSAIPSLLTLDFTEGLKYMTSLRLSLEEQTEFYNNAVQELKDIESGHIGADWSEKERTDRISQLNKQIELTKDNVIEYTKALSQKADIELENAKIDYLNFTNSEKNIKDTFNLTGADKAYIQILKEKIAIKKEEVQATQAQIDKYGEIAKLNYADLKSELSELQEAYDALSTAVTDYNEKGYISIDTFESLIDTYNKYLPLLVNENGQLQLNTQTIYNAMAARIRGMAVSKALARIKEFENKSDAEATELLNKKANALRDLTGVEVQELIMSINRLDVSAETKKAIYNETVEYLKLADAAVKGLGKTSSATSSASKTETKYSDAIKFAQSAIQKKIDALNDEKEAIEKLNEERQKELDYYDKAISYVNTVVDERISALEKEKDALKEKNDETNKEIELEKLKQNLAKAQKTKVKVFRKGQGFVWETDKSAVDEAQKALDDFYSDEKQNAIQKQIDAWNEYKEALGEVTTAYEEEQAKEAFLKNQGFITEEGINNRNLSEIERFKNAYKNKQKQIQETTTDSIDAQIEKWNDLKQSYSDITSNYEYEQERQKAISILGANAEQQILSGRLSVLQEFTRGYTEEMNKQVAAANNAASGISTAYSSASFNIPSADEIGFTSGSSSIFVARGGKNNKLSVTKGMNLKYEDSQVVDGQRYFLIDPKNNRWIRYYESTLKKGKKVSYDDNKKILKIKDSDSKVIYEAYAQGTKSSVSGLANVNELGDELFVPPSRGNYQVLQKGTGILNHGLTERLMAMARNPQSYIKSSMAQMGISTSINKGTTQNITIGNVNLPNVSNAQSFVRELKLISQNR